MKPARAILSYEYTSPWMVFPYIVRAVQGDMIQSPEPFDLYWLVRKVIDCDNTGESYSFWVNCLSRTISSVYVKGNAREYKHRYHVKVDKQNSLTTIACY